MAAFQQLLLRGLLAGRRVAMAPTQARPAFSTTTTTTAGSHFSQIHRPSLEQLVREATRRKQRDTYGRVAAVIVLLSVGVHAALHPNPLYERARVILRSRVVVDL